MDQNLNSKSEYELKKEAREREAQRTLKKARLWRFYKKIAWIIVGSLIVVGLWHLVKRDRTPVNQVGEYFPAQSRDHIEISATHPAYNSNPPTGGWHSASPAKTGIYDIVLPDEQLVHNLEHGHVWFAYRPDLSVDQIEALANIAKDYGSRVIMTPRAANDTPIAVAAWEHLLKMDMVDKEKVESFVKAYRNNGPEKNIPDFDFKDWRTKK